MRPALVLLGAMIGTSCGSEPPQVLTVDQVVPRIHELDGRMVRVAGYLPACDAYDCTLYRTKEDADELDRALLTLGTKAAPVPNFPALGIGTGTNFDFEAKAAPLANGYVVITGAITDECRPELPGLEGQNACLDRGPDLQPAAIAPGTPPTSH